jgi:hypothetical protein
MPAHKGSRHHLAVLTEDNVRSAREEYRKGSTIKELAEKLRHQHRRHEARTQRRHLEAPQRTRRLTDAAA